MELSQGFLRHAKLPKAVAPSLWEGEVLVASISPRVLIVENFLDPALCNQLIQLAEPRLVTSRVSRGVETPSRTSAGTFFTGEVATHPLVEHLEEKLSQLTRSNKVALGSCALEKAEALQVVHYKTGQMYLEHYDNKAGVSITRHATVIVYLTDTPSGGATHFTRSTGLPRPGDLPAPTTAAALAQRSTQLNNSSVASRPGLRVYPTKGRLVLFWSALPCGTEDFNSLHAGEAVVAGEKWIATRWFKEA